VSDIFVEMRKWGKYEREKEKVSQGVREKTFFEQESFYLLPR